MKQTLIACFHISPLYTGLGSPGSFIRSVQQTRAYHYNVSFPREAASFNAHRWTTTTSNRSHEPFPTVCGHTFSVCMQSTRAEEEPHD